jgi:hypothetical protein
VRRAETRAGSTAVAAEVDAELDARAACGGVDASFAVGTVGGRVAAHAPIATTNHQKKAPAKCDAPLCSGPSPIAAPLPVLRPMQRAEADFLVMRLFLRAVFPVVATIVTGGAAAAWPSPALDEYPAAVASSSPPPPVPPTTPPCAKWWAEVRLRTYGYDHVVVIDNRCTKPVACQVSTDVSPPPIDVTVAATERREVLTFMDSPASTFVANVKCKF